MEQNYYPVEYRFDLENGSTLSYAIDIDPLTLISRPPTTGTPPEWAKLEHENCDGCSMKGSDYCPIALRLALPVERFKGLISHTRVTVTVTTPERTYLKKVDAQEGMRSLFGLIMATSGCPSMKPFKFMARYHLPFSSIEETMSRILSTYMLGQYFRHPNTEPDRPHNIPINLEDVSALYSTMQRLNDGMARRLRSSALADSAMNAIIIFSAYSSLIPMMIDKEIRRLRPLFLE
ncbi:MAG: hypothetical protein EBV03_01275 [Proteobacteria bacterium]|nr:hypothetical protein [Pseudomonadota bacterium]